MQRYPMVAFVTLALGITWVCQGIALFLADRNGFTLGNEQFLTRLLGLSSDGATATGIAATLIFILIPGPLIAGLLVTNAVSRRAGLRDLLRSMTMWRVPARWYLIVLALPLVTAVTSLTVAFALTGLHFSDFQPLLPFSLFVPFFLFVLVFTGLAEEPGWRGFALPYLQRTHTAENASWIVGIIWGIWHVPFIFYYNLEAGASLFMLLPLFAGLTIGIVGWTIVNTWVYNSTGSVFMMILLHGWYNTVNSYFVLSSQNMVAQTLNSLLPWVIAIVLLRIYGKENLARRERQKLDVTVPESVGAELKPL